MLDCATPPPPGHHIMSNLLLSLSRSLLHIPWLECKGACRTQSGIPAFWRIRTRGDVYLMGMGMGRLEKSVSMSGWLETLTFAWPSSGRGSARQVQEGSRADQPPCRGRRRPHCGHERRAGRKHQAPHECRGNVAATNGTQAYLGQTHKYCNSSPPANKGNLQEDLLLHPSLGLRWA